MLSERVLKVLFLSTWFPYPVDNGYKIRVFHLLRSLAERHEVTLCSFSFGTSDPSSAGPLREFCTRVVSVPRSPFKRSKAVTLLRFFSSSPIVTLPVPAMRDKVSELLSTPYDAVISSTTVMATYARMATQGVKILEEHNYEAQWALDLHRSQSAPLPQLRTWASWKKRLRYDAQVLPQFDLCTMVSRHDASLMAHDHPAFADRIAVVPNGVDCARNRPGLAERQPRSLVFNGSLTYGANYDAMKYFLSEVLPLVRMRCPDTSLTITGSIEGVNLAGLDVPAGVRLSGNVPDVRPLVAAAQVCVVPIRQGSGTRLKILEAMALGTPVVATSKAAEGLEASDGHHLLIADDPARFSSQVISLLEDDRLRARLAAAARELVVQQYDWPALGSRFTSLIEAQRQALG